MAVFERKDWDDEIIFKNYSPRYVMECIQFTELVRDLPNCNKCLKHGVCEYLPKPGDWVRYNCYAYLGPKTGTNVTKNCDILVESEEQE